MALEFGAAGGVGPWVSVGLTGAGGCGAVCATAGVAIAIPAIIVVAISDPLKVLLDILFPFWPRHATAKICRRIADADFMFLRANGMSNQSDRARHGQIAGLLLHFGHRLLSSQSCTPSGRRSLDWGTFFAICARVV